MTENEVKETKEWLQDFIRMFCCNFDDLETRGLNECVIFLKELEQYRAIGTVEGYENAIKAYTETYILMKEYKSKLKDFEAIGTIEEFKGLKEKMQDVEIMIIERMQEFYDEYRSISQSRVDHFGGKADAIETSQQIVKGAFKDVLGIDWQ